MPSTLVLVGGAIGDLYGRRRVFTFGIVKPPGANCRAHSAAESGDFQQLQINNRIASAIGLIH